VKLVFNCLIASSVLLAGCASESYCLRQQRYDKAQSVAPIAAGEGLSLPQSPTALKVPPPPANDTPFGILLTGGRKSNNGTRVQCLDQPPPLPATIQNPPTS